MHNQNKKGFTLVELLVVVAIIGLLSTIAVVSLGSARTKARDAKRVADMKQVATALEQFYSDQNGYPASAVLATSYAIDAKVLCSTNTSASTAIQGSSCAGTAYTTIPTYPLPGKNVTALAGCTTAASGANADYCYSSDTLWASSNFATSYTIKWQLEATNASYNGSNCTTTPAGVICS